MSPDTGPWYADISGPEAFMIVGVAWAIAFAWWALVRYMR